MKTSERETGGQILSPNRRIVFIYAAGGLWQAELDWIMNWILVKEIIKLVCIIQEMGDTLSSLLSVLSVVLNLTLNEFALDYTIMHRWAIESFGCSGETSVRSQHHFDTGVCLVGLMMAGRGDICWLVSRSGVFYEMLTANCYCELLMLPSQYFPCQPLLPAEPVGWCDAVTLMEPSLSPTASFLSTSDRPNIPLTMPSLCHTQVITAKMELNNFNVQLPLQGDGFYCQIF